MLDSKERNTDVLVIGSGIAGLAAAIRAREEGRDVLLVSKAGIGKQSATYFSGAWFKYTTQELNLPGYDSSPQRYIFDEQQVKMHLERAKEGILWLKNLGVPLEAYGEWYLTPRREDEEDGVTVVEALRKKLKESGTGAIGNCLIVDLLVREGQCIGAAGLDQNGDVLVLRAGCTILATGGGASLFKETSSPRSLVGDGYAMALRAGLPLTNMEFIQFEVGFVGVAFPWQGDIISEIITVKGVRLVNKKGEDLVRKYLGLRWEQVCRYASFKFEESEKIMEMEGGPVFLDMTGISSADWSKMHPRTRMKLAKCPRDVKRFPVEMIPIGHTYLGGVTTDKTGETQLRGLFAAGEMVSGTYAGENSVNHLTRCLVMGIEAGKNAAQTCKELEQERTGLTDRQKEFLQEISLKNGKRRPLELRKKIRELVNKRMSPVRSGPSLLAGIDELTRIKEEKKNLSADNTPDLKEAIEVENMLLLAEALLRSAEFRKESRGPHYREDYPTKDPLFYKTTRVQLDRDEKPLNVDCVKLRMEVK